MLYGLPWCDPLWIAYRASEGAGSRPTAANLHIIYMAAWCKQPPTIREKEKHAHTSARSRFEACRRRLGEFTYVAESVLDVRR